MEKETIVKHKLFITDIDKVQQFIDSYREKGYKLAYINGDSFSFIFKKSQDDFIPKVRIDYHSFKNRADFQEYLTLFEDAGWKHLNGSFSSGLQYFEQMNEDSDDEIFSDKQSHAELYGRLFAFAISFLFLFLIYFIVFGSKYDISLLLHPKDLFYTPGLWELTGFKFVFAFLFELPFVFLRNGFPVLWLVCVILFSISAIKVKRKELALKKS